jgi:hypothetical protein
METNSFVLSKEKFNKNIIRNFNINISEGYVPKNQELSRSDLSKRKTIWIMYGWNGIVSIKSIINKIDKTSKLIVVENDFSRIKWGCEDSFFVSEIIKSGDLSIVVEKSIEEAVLKVNDLVDFREFDEWMPLNGWACLDSEIDLNDFYKPLRESLNFKIVNLNTILYQTKFFLQNSLINLPLVVSDLNNEYLLKCKLDDRPFLIVSGGPSLDKQLEILKNNKDKFRICVMGQTLPALKAFDIEPDFIITLDNLVVPNWNSSSESIHISDIGLDPVTVWKTIDKNLYFGHNTLILSILNQFEINLPILEAGGSVACSAFSFAQLIEAQPIVFIGQDLAITEDSDHTKFALDQDRFDDDKRRELLKSCVSIEGYYGGKVFSPPDFLMFKHWFENKIKNNPNLIVFNCTEGGARINGSIQMSFKGVCDGLSSLNNSKLNIKSKYNREVFDASVLIKAKRILKSLSSFKFSFNRKLKRILSVDESIFNDSDWLGCWNMVNECDSIIRLLFEIYSGYEIRNIQRLNIAQHERDYLILKAISKGVGEATLFFKDLVGFYSVILTRNIPSDIKLLDDSCKDFIKKYSRIDQSWASYLD